MADQKATISMGATALVLAVLGVVVFFIGTRGVGTNNDVGMIMFAGGGVVMFAALFFGLRSAVTNEGRVLGVISLILVTIAAVISEIR